MSENNSQESKYKEQGVSSYTEKSGRPEDLVACLVLEASRKEKEWRAAEETKANGLTAALKSSVKELEDMKTKFKLLKDDFKYNLGLLESRDQELAKFDVAYAELSQLLHNKDADISDLKVELDAARSNLNREKGNVQQLRYEYDKKLRKSQEDMNAWKVAKEIEITQLEDMHIQDKQELENKLKATEQKLNTIESELTVKNDMKLQQELRQLKQQLSEALQGATDSECRAQQVEVDLRASNSKLEDLKNDLQKESYLRIDAEKKQREKEWEIKSLQHEVETIASTFQWQMEREKNNLANTIADLHGKMAVLQVEVEQAHLTAEARVKALQDQERDLKNTVREAQRATDDMRKELFKAEEVQAKHTAVLKSKEAELQQSKETMMEMQREFSHSLSARDAELRSLNENMKRKEDRYQTMAMDVERYKQENVQLSQTESQLKHQLKQKDDEWGHHVEQAKTQLKIQQDDFVRQLLDERRQLASKLDNANRLAEELKNENAKLCQEKETALRQCDDLRQAQNTEQLPPSGFVSVQKENSRLKTAIKQMRIEMEDIAKRDSEELKELEYLKAQLSEMQSDIVRKTSQLADSEAAISELKRVARQTNSDNRREPHVQQLKKTIEEAVKDIQRLVQERDQLLNLSNELNAELSRIKRAEEGETMRVAKELGDKMEPSLTESKKQSVSMQQRSTALNSSMSSSLDSEAIHSIFRVLDSVDEEDPKLDGQNPKANNNNHRGKPDHAPSFTLHGSNWFKKG
eukprot:m.81599 g.81599  ORF g.81599 m.81599 type:complete len:752 (-) comp12815_c0_seq7:2535-4790(-)